MGKNFHSVIYSREGKVTLELAGEIDGSSAAELCWKLQELGIRECTLDFSRVEAIDVFGAQVLARGLKALRNRGVRFEVEGLPERVAGTLCLGGVLEALV
jgi:anti-anti-sigma factor